MVDTSLSMPTLLSSYSAESIGRQSLTSKDVPRSPLLRSGLSATARSHESLKMSGLIRDIDFDKRKPLNLYSTRVYKAYDYEVAEVRPDSPDSVYEIDEIPTLDDGPSNDVNDENSNNGLQVASSPSSEGGGHAYVQEDGEMSDTSELDRRPNAFTMTEVDEDSLESVLQDTGANEEIVNELGTADDELIVDDPRDIDAFTPPSNGEHVENDADSTELDSLEPPTPEAPPLHVPPQARSVIRVDVGTELSEPKRPPPIIPCITTTLREDHVEYADIVVQCDLDAEIQVISPPFPPPIPKKEMSETATQSMQIEKPISNPSDPPSLETIKSLSKLPLVSIADARPAEIIHNARLAAAIKSARALKSAQIYETSERFVSHQRQSRYSNFDYDPEDSSVLQLNKKFLTEWADQLDFYASDDVSNGSYHEFT